MAEWNEIADDHYVALSWSGGLGIDNDGYPLEPPSSDPSMNEGIDARIARSIQRRVVEYRCKFCRSLIGFLDRKPLNLVDGSPHRCLANAAHGIKE